jgi:hypothetical protein
MFTTIAEAEKAARVLMQHLHLETLIQETTEDFVLIRSPFTANVEYIAGWDEVADLLLVAPPAPTPEVLE